MAKQLLYLELPDEICFMSSSQLYKSSLFLLFSISNLHFDMYAVKMNEIKCKTHSNVSILALEFMLYRESEIAVWLHQFGSLFGLLTKRWHHEYGDKL